MFYFTCNHGLKRRSFVAEDNMAGDRTLFRTISIMRSGFDSVAVALLCWVSVVMTITQLCCSATTDHPPRRSPTVGALRAHWSPSAYQITWINAYPAQYRSCINCIITSHSGLSSLHFTPTYIYVSTVSKKGSSLTI